MRYGILVLLLFLCVSGTAFGKIYQRISRPALLSIMKKHEFRGVPSDKNKRHIIFMIEGYRSLLIVHESKKSIQWYIGFNDSKKANLTRVNEWNKNRKYSRSYIDNEGDPVLELDLDLTGGVTCERIVDFLQTCKLSLPLWKKEVVD